MSEVSGKLEIVENSILISKSSFLNVERCQLRTKELDTGVSKDIERVVSPDDLKTVLDLGRTSILEVNPFRLWVVHLGNANQTDGKDSDVLTEKGYESCTGIGIYTSVDEIDKKFHDYWNIIGEAGFMPEVRLTTGKNLDGSWLLLGQKINKQ